jgi:hypothetical protein
MKRDGRTGSLMTGGRIELPGGAGKNPAQRKSLGGLRDFGWKELRNQ